MKFLTLLVTFTFISTSVFANDSIEYKATPLTSSIYMLEGDGGNITASIGQDGVLLVDTDMAEMHEKLLAKLIELKGSSPRFIINTHFHYDHTGGNKYFPKATIIGAEAVHTRLSNEQILWRQTHPAVLDGRPNLSYGNHLKLQVNNEEVQVIQCKNAHTDGDTVVYFPKNKVISMGDLYFSGMYPIFHPEHLGSLSGFLKCIDEVITLIPNHTQIVPGHGPLSNKSELVEYRQMIGDSIEVVKRGIGKKWDLKKIIAAGLPTKWDKYSHGYRNTEQWITSIFEQLKGI